MLDAYIAKDVALIIATRTDIACALRGDLIAAVLLSFIVILLRHVDLETDASTQQ